MNFKKLFIGITAMSVMFTSCSSSKDDPASSGEASIEISQPSLSFPNTTASGKIQVSSNRDWSAIPEKGATWVNITPDSHSASDSAVEVTVTVDDNDSSSERSTTIIFSNGARHKELTVTQAAGSEVNPEPVGTNLLSNGGFEEWAGSAPVDWATIGIINTADNYAKESQEVHGGSYSVKITGVNGSNKRFHSKVYALKAGSYSLSVYAKGEGAVRIGWAKTLKDGTVENSSAYSYLTDANAPGNTWANYSGSFTLTENTYVSIFVAAAKTADPFYIDDISLTTQNGGIDDSQSGGGSGDGTLDLSNYNSIDGYYYSAGTDAYWDFDFYYWDYTTGSASIDDLYLMVDAKSKTLINGTYEIYADGEYCGYYADGETCDPIVNGTLTLTVVEEGTEEYFPLYKAVINATFKSGKTINQTLDNMEVIAFDFDSYNESTGEFDYIELQDKVSKAAFSNRHRTARQGHRKVLSKR